MNKEIFVEIADYPDYEVSNFGVVRSKDMARVVPSKWGGTMERKTKGKVLKTWSAGRGYEMVGLGAGGRNKHYVHRLVAEAFCDGQSPHKEVNHKDGDKNNNSFENLEWVTKSQNMLHRTHILNKKSGQFVRGGGRVG